MKITQPTARDIEHYGKSAETMLKEGMFPRMHTLLSLRQGYHDQSTGIRQSVHNKFGYGERVADLVDTTGAKKQSNGFLRLAYIQQPDDVVYEDGKISVRKGKINSGKVTVKGRKRINVDVPQSGWQVPTSDGLWHPETGTAFATVGNRNEAVKQMQKYIENHPEQFAKFNPQNPQELAGIEVSYQWRPEANVGVGSVWRGFWRRDRGPFYVSLDADLSTQIVNVGVRLK